MLAAAFAQQAPVFRAGVDLVNLAVTVTDRRGNLNANLKAGDFDVFEDGKRQTIRNFTVGESASGPGPDLHIAVMLDVSESMVEQLSFTKTAAIRFLNSLLDAADITVVDFDSEVRVARYGQEDFPRLVERIRQQNAKGTTALYDAIGVYLHGAAGQDGRKIMVLYTDGGDTVSSLRSGELIDLLEASDVTVFTIGSLTSVLPDFRSRQRAILTQIAEVTGGEAFFPISVSDVDGIYRRILAQIRTQYLIGYISSNEKTDGTWRKIDVKIVSKDAREYQVRARNGYFAKYKAAERP